MYKKAFVFKRKTLILLLIGLFTLSGCEHTGDYPIGADVNYTDEGINEGYTETEDRAGTENSETVVSFENTPKPLEAPVSMDAEDILYHSTDDIDISLSMHRCKSDGENIYLVYGAAGELDLYSMPIGTDEHSQVNINNPEGMVICHIAIDIYGNIHLLVAGNDYEEWFIWRLNENNQIEEELDISDYFEIRQMPHWFLVDMDGTYYLQWVIGRDGVIVDSEGELKHRFTLESLDTGWTYEAAVGKDGRIYLVYRGEDEKLEIGEFDVENCTIKREDSPLCFSRDEVFIEMSGGTDTNLLLFSPYSGVWAYDFKKGILENRVSLSDIGITRATNFGPLTFLPDGRLLLLEKRGNDTYLRYIPAGK